VWDTAGGKDPKPAPADRDRAKPGDRLVLDLGEGVKLELVLVPAGKFLRGSPNTDPNSYDSEKPQRKITISKSFYLGKYEVTVAQFRAFVKDTGHKTDAETGDGGWGYSANTRVFQESKVYNWKYTGFPQTDKHPVGNVSWNDASAFCKWLKK